MQGAWHASGKPGHSQSSASTITLSCAGSRDAARSRSGKRPARQALYDAAGSIDKTLREFTAEEGGAQHCMHDYLSLGVAEMWNGIEDKLVRP